MEMDGPPWALPSSDLALPTLFGGVMTDERCDDEILVRRLRAAVELAASWIGVDVTWSVWNRGTQWSSISWSDELWADIVAHGVDGFTVHGECTALLGEWDHPNREIAQVTASTPQYVDELSRDVGQTAVRLSVQRWAMYGSGEDIPWFAGPLDQWIVESAVALGAQSGYAILDTVRAQDTKSAWEYRHQISPVFRRPAQQVWGEGWGTLLTRAHLDVVGGLEAVAAVPGARVRELPGGTVWLTLGDDPAAVPDASMHALHEVLLPALPPADGDYSFDHILPGGSVFTAMAAQARRSASGADLRRSWEAQAEAARAGGRTHGMLGPVGYTVDAGVPELLFDLALGAAADAFFFRGLGAEQAAPLLAALDPAVLDHRTGPGPTLGAALRAAVAHPGVVLLTGHVVGPVRDDERLTVDGLLIRGDPVLDGLGDGDLARAWDRVVALGIDALEPPDELRAPSTPSDEEPDGNPEAWTVWWD